VSAVLDTLRAFAVADLTDWCGVPGDLGVAYVGAALPLDEALTGEGFLGEERRPASWLRAESATYRGGLRVWHENGRVLLIEGRDPVDEDGEPVVVPDLGEPEVALDAAVGRLLVTGGERVYALRGLAVRVHPENGALLCAMGFAIATADFYRAQRRPDPEPERLLPIPDTGDAA
jgi:hypothetical protein